MTSMKIKSLFCLLPLGLAGCAGYNHTLFMTKSNAGLDFDTKPPTLEVTISRKEAVITPVFEGGQTPPVAASFKPKAGVESGFAKFFLGVDQTFEGGDAAAAMSELYGQTVTPPATDLSKYDSAITLTKAPAYTGWWRRLAGPGETRAFIFGTDTSLGLKAAWTGTGGQFPDTVRLGFHRKEFAWAPLSLTPNVQGTGATATTNFQVRIPSFLATIDSKLAVGASSNASVSALQYFATGKAATLLALQPAVRAAFVERLDPGSVPEAQVLARQQYASDQQRADEIVAWLQNGGAKLDAGRVDTIVKDTALDAATLKAMTPEQLRKKLAGSWSLDIAALYKNKP